MKCGECGKDFRMFMVKNFLWESAGLREEMICMNCFEEKIGRKLKLKDFTRVLCNNWIRKGVAMEG